MEVDKMEKMEKDDDGMTKLPSKFSAAVNYHYDKYDKKIPMSTGMAPDAIPEFMTLIHACRLTHGIPMMARRAMMHGRKKSSLVFTLKDQIGGLAAALKVLDDYTTGQKNKINVLHIESRKSKTQDAAFDIFIDLHTDNIKMDDMLGALADKVTNLAVIPSAQPGPMRIPSIDYSYSLEGISVPWFPKKISDLDKTANRVLMYGSELDAEHPSFKDPEYRKRRQIFTEAAMSYRHGNALPVIEYTELETKTWGTVFKEVTKLYATHACKEFLANFATLMENCGYREDNIPNINDISNFLKERSGFQLRPVAGYLSPRDFLAGLAFRVFQCTQYVRHHSEPFYTPEPDTLHELLGHVPLFADPTFAQFSQEIGLASLGATDDEIAKLTNVYFFTVEFGLCKEAGKMKVFGAGLLSSASELKHVLSDKASILPYDTDIVIATKPIITSYQDVYFFVQSFDQAQERLRAYARSIKRPFSVRYNPYTKTVEVLNTAASIASVIDQMRGELANIGDALNKMEELNNPDDVFDKNIQRLNISYY